MASDRLFELFQFRLQPNGELHFSSSVFSITYRMSPLAAESLVWDMWQIQWAQHPTFVSICSSRSCRYSRWTLCVNAPPESISGSIGGNKKKRKNWTIATKVVKSKIESFKRLNNRLNYRVDPVVFDLVKRKGAQRAAIARPRQLPKCLQLRGDCDEALWQAGVDLH